MKVVMIGWEFPPFCSGGLGVHCYEVARRLSKHVDLVFFTPFNVSNPGIKIVSLGHELNPYHLSMDLLAAVRKYVEAVIKKARDMDCDIIHCHDWLTALAGIKLKELTGKPFILTIHSTEWDRTAGNPWKWIEDIERLGCMKADLVITVSHRMKRILVERYGIPEEKIRVIYNGIDPKEFDVDKEFSGNIILYLGRLSIQKGVDHLIRAFKLVLEHKPDSVLLIAGKGPHIDYLVNLAIELGIHDKVYFLGYVSEEEKRRLLSMADVFVMPSVSEPFGIVALEAMASGTPCILSKNSGVSEVVNHCFKVDFWDSKEMASRILEILHYKELKEEMGWNGKKEVWKLSWDRCVEELLEVYRSLA